jgi:hypothetical protein
MTSAPEDFDLPDGLDVDDLLEARQFVHEHQADVQDLLGDERE